MPIRPIAIGLILSILSYGSIKHFSKDGKDSSNPVIPLVKSLVEGRYNAQQEREMIYMLINNIKEFNEMHPEIMSTIELNFPGPNGVKLQYKFSGGEFPYYYYTPGAEDIDIETFSSASLKFNFEASLNKSPQLAALIQKYMEDKYANILTSEQFDWLDEAICQIKYSYNTPEYIPEEVIVNVLIPTFETDEISSGSYYLMGVFVVNSEGKELVLDTSRSYIKHPYNRLVNLDQNDYEFIKAVEASCEELVGINDFLKSEPLEVSVDNAKFN